MDTTHNQHRSRMKQRFINNGLEGFQPHEMVELLLYYAIPRADTNPLAHRLIDRFGSIGGVLSASQEELLAVEGMGENSATYFSLLSALFRYSRLESVKLGRDAGSLQKAVQYARELFAGIQAERLYLLCLDSRQRVQREILLAQGSATEMVLSPRTVLDAVLRANAASVIFLHNHPGGSETPSQADLDFTATMELSLGFIDVTISDHIIVGSENVFSFAHHGLLNRNRKLIPPETKADTLPYDSSGQ